MTIQEESSYKVIVHLTDGTKLRVHGRVSASDLMECYRCLGAEEGRIKFPTSPTKMHFIPATSVFRIEANGDFD